MKSAVKKVAKTAAKKVTTAKKQVKKTVAEVSTPQTASTSPVSIAVAKVAPVQKKKAAPKAAKKTVASELTQINGIGPSLAAIMMDNGIKTIKDLQEATPTALKVIATKAGNRYKSFDTNQWVIAAQAFTK